MREKMADNTSHSIIDSANSLPASQSLRSSLSSSLQSEVSSTNAYNPSEIEEVNDYTGSGRAKRVLSRIRSRDLHSLYSDISGVTTLTKQVTRTLGNIRDAVADDNMQDAVSDADSMGGLVRLLTSRFDVGDAYNMNDAGESEEEEEEEGEEEGVTGVAGGQQSLELGNISQRQKQQIVSDLEMYPSGGSESPGSPKHRLPQGSEIHSGQSLLGQQESGKVGEEEEKKKLKKRLGPNLLQRVFGNKDTGALDLPPDKGYAWVASFNCWLVMFNTWGCNAAFGVFLSFFLNNDVFPGANRYDYALVAGMSVAMGQVFAPPALICMRLLGVRPVVLFGAVLMCVGFVLASYSVKYWQLLMTQGVMVGISLAFSGAPLLTILPGWFLKWRAVAIGAALFGTGAGGVTYALAVNKMIQDHGDTKLCFQMLAITCSVSVGICVLLARTRTPVTAPGPRNWALIKSEIHRMFQLRVFIQPKVILIALWFTLSLFGYNLMIFTLSPYAVARGMTQHQGSSLTAIMNGAQSIGRPLMGLAGDRYGRANLTVLMTIILTILMYGFWLPAHTYVQLIFFSIMVGCCVGVANVMNTVLLADMVGPGDFLPAWAFVNSAPSPALLCSEIVAQALTDDKRPSNPYRHTQIFAGCCFCAALILIFLLREIAVENKLKLRQMETLEKVKKKEKLGEDSQVGRSGSHTGDQERLEGEVGDGKIKGVKEQEAVEEDWELLNKRRDRYEVLLGRGPWKYFMRMFYPIKV